MELQVAGSDIRWTAEKGVQALYGILHHALRGLPMVAVEETLDAVNAWAGGRPDAGEGLAPRTLDEKEILALAAHPLVELGSHGATHRALPGLSGHVLLEEIGGSRLRLERLISKPVRSFSYPFGLLDESVHREIAREGYKRACSSRNGLISRKADPLQLPRIWPPNANGETMRRWLHGWTGR
jgi:peptidoglycan/xylan/chitin deacetylase (PgdA/CDA1 family)